MIRSHIGWLDAISREYSHPCWDDLREQYGDRRLTLEDVAILAARVSGHTVETARRYRQTLNL